MRRLLLGLLCLLSVPASAGGLYGIALMEHVVGVNLEWTTTHNSFYIIPGVYFNQSTGGAGGELRWVAGFRHKLEGTMNDDGFYVGLLGGDLGDGSSWHRRRGYGGEIGYQFVTKHTRWTLDGGIVILEHDGYSQEHQVNKTEPSIVLGVSLSIR